MSIIVVALMCIVFTVCLIWSQGNTLAFIALYGVAAAIAITVGVAVVHVIIGAVSPPIVISLILREDRVYKKVKGLR